MNRTLTILLFFIATISINAQNVKLNRGLAEQIIHSEMARSPQAWALEGSNRPKWTYTIGLELAAMMQYQSHSSASTISKDELLAYAKTYYDALINDNGIISGYKMSDFKLDDINSGKLLFTLYELTKEPKYKIAADTLYKQLSIQPTTPEGGYWHKKIYPQQMWLDGLYMAEPFKAEYVSRNIPQNEKAKLYDEIVRQFTLSFEKTICHECHLPHHAWDSAHKQSWCDPSTGRSAHAWGRAIGWYMMALVDTYEIIRNDSPDYSGIDSLALIVNRIASEMIRLQDKKNGCWQQVLDLTGKEGNYFEMSVTPMTAYSFLKSNRLGILPKAFAKAGKKALKGMCRNFIEKDESTGRININNICSVGGLSDDRDGSFEYYLSEPIRVNDPKGVGPFILALTELQR